MRVQPVNAPLRRPLRVFAFDPMRGTGRLSVVSAAVENEPVTPGPGGERVQVIDYDASRDCYYAPIDLEHPSVLMQAGLDPTEADPRFHQQMVYAITLTVLENFDRALGRRISFRGEPLRLLPHAFRGANAFFDPNLNAVCFGYFTADRDRPGENLPGQTIFTCLSQDIVAHEVTHAVVHRLRGHFLEPSNRDVLAFHEGFADIVAIFQHFTFPAVLSDAIAATRGELYSSSSLVDLATQFGHATGKNDALRTAVDTPDPGRYTESTEPHERGAILVAAVFEAFFTVYQARIRDLIRIASEGRGVLPIGDLHPDLVDRLAREASRAAQEVLTMCIRAFEYLPPVDITLGDYLRALITADYDLLADAGLGQRRAMIEAFRRRGIFPDGVISLSDDALRWPLAPKDLAPMPAQALAQRIATGARTFHNRARGDAPELAGADPAYRKLYAWAKKNCAALDLDPDLKLNVHGFHATYRVKSDGELVIEVVAQFTQKEDTTGQAQYGGLPKRAGTTVIATADGTVRFAISKPFSDAREARQLAFVSEHDLADPALPWANDAYLQQRARGDLGRLHRGLFG